MAEAQHPTPECMRRFDKLEEHIDKQSDKNATVAGNSREIEEIKRRLNNQDGENKVLVELVTVVRIMGENLTKVAQVVDTHTTQLNNLSTLPSLVDSVSTVIHRVETLEKAPGNRVLSYVDHTIKWLLIGTLSLAIIGLGYYLKGVTVGGIQ